MTDPDLAVMKGIVETYNGESPAVPAELVQIPPAEVTDTSKLMTAVRGGIGPDVYFLDRFIVAQRAADGVLQDLTAFPGGDTLLENHLPFARAEATYQDLKGRCFGLGRSRLAAPGRVDRLLLALVLALWWADDLGARAVRAGLRRRDDRPGRGARSRLRVGLARLADLLDQGKPPPFPFRPCPDGWLHPWLA